MEKLSICKATDVKDENHGIFLLKNRLHHKKILFVLDDVNKSDQMDKLIEEHDWFDSDSRIIIITRDVRLLECKVDNIYEAEDTIC